MFQNVGRARQQCLHEPIVDFQFATEIDGSRLLNEDRIRATVDYEAVDLVRNDDAAGPFAALDDQRLQAVSLQLPRCRQSGDASANNDYWMHVGYQLSAFSF